MGQIRPSDNECPWLFGVELQSFLCVFYNNTMDREVDVSIGGQLEPEAKYIIDAGIEAGVSQPNSYPIQAAYY